MNSADRAALLRARFAQKRPSLTLRFPRKTVSQREPERRWAHERKRGGFKAEVSGPSVLAHQPKWVKTVRKARPTVKIRRGRKVSPLTAMSAMLLVKPKRAI